VRGAYPCGLSRYRGCAGDEEVGRDGRVAPSSPPVPSTRSSRQPSPRGRVTPAGRASGASARHGRKAGDAIRRWRVAAEASDASGGRVEGLGLGGESSGSRACRRLHRFCPQRLHGPCRRSRRLGVVRENIRGWGAPAGDVAGVRHARDLPPRWHVRQETQRMVSWYLKFQKLRYAALETDAGVSTRVASLYVVVKTACSKSSSVT